MKKVLVLMASILLVFGMVCSASALYIDFTESNPWAAADGSSSYTASNYDGWLDVTLNGFNSLGRARNITYQADGLGVDTFLGEDDEVDGFETLQVSFSPDVFVNSISLYDVENDETALYRLEGSAWIPASGSLGTGSLFEIVTGSTDLVSWVQVSADSGLFWSDNVALAGLDVSTAPVPEPATMFLLGTGLLGLAVTSRKKIFKKK